MPVILLAEDDLADQELVRRALRKRRCDVRMVPDGVALLDYLTQAEPAAEGESKPKPDIIVLDLNMPRKDGREALREIRTKLACSATPIIVFSTSDNVTDVKECYEAGCNSYITKPAELDDFNAALDQAATYWLDVSALP